MKKLGTAIKTEIQHSFPLEKDAKEKLDALGLKFMGARNLFFSRFSGIGTIGKYSRKYDCHNQVIGENLISLAKVPARYWKLALTNVLGNIRTLIENVKQKIRKAMYNNQNLSASDRHYMNTVLKKDKYLGEVLNMKKLSEYLYEKFDVNFRRLNSLIRRYFRKYRGKTPYSVKSNFLVADSGTYKYEDDKILKISTLIPRKRISVKMKEEKRLSGNLILKWEECLHVYGTQKFEVPDKVPKENVVAIDKGESALITSISGRQYGNEYRNINKELINKQVKKNANRNRIFQHMKKLEKKGELEKAGNMQANNLGKKKQEKLSGRIRERSRSYINRTVNEFLDTEFPSEVVKEDLSWEKKSRKTGKGFRARIARWEKGVLDDSLEWKAYKSGIKVTNVNPAYTSQVHHECGKFGKRNGRSFRCSHCDKEMNADVNAAYNIMERKNIKEITLYTSAIKVKEYYKKLEEGEMLPDKG